MIATFKFDSVTKVILMAALTTYYNKLFGYLLISAIYFSITLNFSFISAQIDTKDFCNFILTYNVFVLSFSLASMTLVLALPSVEFAVFLAKKRTRNGIQIIPYRNLLISFFQVAISHYISLMLVFFILFLSSEKMALGEIFIFTDFKFYVWIFQVWAFIIFGMALKDIAALGCLYAVYLSNGDNKRENAPTE